MTALSGMKAISNYTNRSEATVLAWIREYDFPATKLGGSWESDTQLVDEWRREQIRVAKKSTREAIAHE